MALVRLSGLVAFVRRHRGKFLVALLALAALLYFLLGGKGDKQPIRYETQKASRGDIVARVTATGTLSALVTVQVGSQVSGRLIEINVDYNSPVKKGQVLAKIDPELFNAQREQGRANLLGRREQSGQGQGAGPGC